MISTLLPDLIKESYDNSVEHGFHELIPPKDELSIPTRICLIHEELSEALREFRKTSPGTIRMPDPFVEELADAVIRIFDLVGIQEIVGTDRFIRILMNKMVINRGRPKYHNKRI